MNERIKELAPQAGMYEYPNALWTTYRGNLTTVETTAFEKFAELVSDSTLAEAAILFGLY